MRKRCLELCFAWLLMIMSMFLLTGCGMQTLESGSTEPVRISFSWWGNDERHDYTLEAIRKFEELNPDIKVDCKYSEWSGYENRYHIQMAAGTETDVMQINYGWLQQYSPNGTAYYDLRDLEEDIELDNFEARDLRYGEMNGRLNAVPIAMNTPILIYNKTIYDAYGLSIPKTWADLFHCAETMNGEVYPLEIHSKNAWFLVGTYASQLAGKPMMDRLGKMNFTEQDFQNMYEFYLKMLNEKVMPPVEEYNLNKLSSGVCAGTMCWINDSDSVKKSTPSGNEIVVGEFLHNTESFSGDGWYAKPATMYAISAKTDHPRESARLLNFLLNSREMALLQKTEKGIPLSKKAEHYLEKSDAANDFRYVGYDRYSEYRGSIGTISFYLERSEFIEAFNEGVRAIEYGQSTIPEEAKKLRDLIMRTTGESSASEKEPN